MHLMASAPNELAEARARSSLCADDGRLLDGRTDLLLVHPTQVCLLRTSHSRGRFGWLVFDAQVSVCHVGRRRLGYDVTALCMAGFQSELYSTGICKPKHLERGITLSRRVKSGKWRVDEHCRSLAPASFRYARLLACLRTCVACLPCCQRASCWSHNSNAEQASASATNKQTLAGTSWRELEQEKQPPVSLVCELRVTDLL